MTYTPEDIGLFASGLWAGWLDDYAHWTGDGWRRRGDPLTPAALVAAWTEAPGVSFYFLGPDGRGHVPAMDFDGPDAHAQALGAGQLLWSRGIPAYVELSPSGGHLWVSLTRRQPAVTLRRGLLATRQALGLEVDGSVEIRPVSDRQGSLGGSLRAPMTISPKTGERYPLVDPRTQRPVHAKVAGTLRLVEQADARAWAALGETYRMPDMIPPAATPERQGRISVFNESVPVSQILQGHGATWARPGVGGRCPYHDDARPSGSVSRDDRRYWCHSPSCPASRDGLGMDAWDLAQLRATAAA